MRAVAAGASNPLLKAQVVGWELAMTRTADCVTNDLVELPSDDLHSTARWAGSPLGGNLVVANLVSVLEWLHPVAGERQSLAWSRFAH